MDTALVLHAAALLHQAADLLTRATDGEETRAVVDRRIHRTPLEEEIEDRRQTAERARQFREALPEPPRDYAAERQARQVAVGAWLVTHGFRRIGRAPSRHCYEHRGYRCRWDLTPTRAFRLLRHPADLAQPLVAWTRTADLELRLVHALWSGGYRLAQTVELHPEDLPKLCPRFALLGGLVFPAEQRGRSGR